MSRLYTRFFAGYVSAVREAYQALEKSFRNKKILIISEKKIISIPISSKIQIFFASVALVVMLWLSFSTGKYFAYEEIISQKDKEIWTSQVTNETLQYQVSDLNKNLSELNRYFERIREHDKLSGTGLLGDQKDGVFEGEQLALDYPGGAQKILFNIREKIVERIESLESIVRMTGLKLEEVAVHNGDLKRALTEVEDSKHQGGPFIPASDDVSNRMFNKDEFDSEIKYLMQLERILHTFPLSAPMRRFYLTSRFGKRIDPIHKRIAMHNGLDLVGPYRAKIYATAPGVVIYARDFGAYGRMVQIDHGSGISTRFGHLHKIFVKKGDKVTRGQLIGLEGSSGRSTGNHLHYEVRYNNKPLNPENFLKAGKYVF